MKNEFDNESRVLKALAHKTRMAIVAELLKTEKCVGDIEGRLKARQANISQHLSVLRWAGIVDCRTEGKNRCYYLKDPKTMGTLCRALKQVKT
jgi:DNA-binding transcriptional ArsR family regulator